MNQKNCLPQPCIYSIVIIPVVANCQSTVMGSLAFKHISPECKSGKFVCMRKETQKRERKVHQHTFDTYIRLGNSLKHVKN